MQPLDIAPAIPRRLERLRDDIAHIARQAGRGAAEVRLIAVSKTQPAACVAAALAAGHCDFGENTLQDALTKIPVIARPPAIWHFIGHLQSNKVKHLPGNFAWLHSLDSVNLARRLSHQLQGADTTLQALIEVNITGEPRRHGVRVESVFPFLDQLLQAPLPGIVLRGFMAIGPHPAEAAEVHRAFAQVRELRDAVVQRYALPGFTELSMGMSGDYRMAIQEGSTMVRIGTAIFGARDIR